MESSSQKLVLVEVIILVMTLVTFGLFAFSLRLDPRPVLMAVAVTLGFLWVAITTYGLGIIESRFNALVIFIALPAVLALVGLGQPSVLGAALILGLLLFAAHTRAQEEISSRREYHPWPVFAGASQMVFVGLVISFAGLTLPLLATGLVSANFAIPPQRLAVALQPLSGLINTWLPGYTPHATVDTLISNQIQKSQPGFTPSSQEITQIRQELSGNLQVPLDSEDTLPAVLSKYIDLRLTAIASAYPFFSALTLLISIILLSRLLIPVLASISRLIILLLDFLAIKSGLVLVTKQSQLVDIVSI